MKVNREQFLAAAILMATSGSAGCGKLADSLKNKIGASATPDPAADTTTGGGEATGNVDTASPSGSVSVGKGTTVAPGKVAFKTGATGPAKELGGPARELGVGPAKEFPGPARELGVGPAKEWPGPAKEFGVRPANELPAPAKEWPAPSAKPGWPPPPASASAKPGWTPPASPSAVPPKKK